MKRGSLLLKTIELPTRFVRRLLQGSMFCTVVIVIFLFIIRFPKFCLKFQSAENVSLVRDVLWRSRTRKFMYKHEIIWAKIGDSRI